MSTTLEFRGLASVRLEDAWEMGRFRIAVCASGYERRSSHWFSRARDVLGLDCENTTVFGFSDYSDALSRPENNQIYASHGCEMIPVASHDCKGFVDRLDETLARARARAGSAPLELHVDYSCMPRSWYCRIPSLLSSRLGSQDSACMWYSAGRYAKGVYPSAGVEDFRAFSGRASLNAQRRTHFMGLGFDWTRSSAIRSVVDPQRVVCFFAEAGTTPSNHKRAMRDNAALISSAELLVRLPLDDFAMAISSLAEKARMFREWGDVVIVPDGPKPLILASSLVPLLLQEDGVVCLHVGHRRHKFVPVNVMPRGPVWGFRFLSSRSGSAAF